MDSNGSRGPPSSIDNSSAGFLEPGMAHEILFEKILDQFADSGLFSSELSTSIFVVYAHNNEKEGTAYDECVRKLITWLERIHAQILSDHSPLPTFIPSIEGIDPIGNILGNQMCLLPPSCYGAETPKVRTIDKVIVCGSVVLETYCRRTSARAYIEDIIQICTNGACRSTKTTLESAIRERVDKECDRDDFHHVLTEIAFLEARRFCLSEAHGMVPVLLNETNPDQAPMRYLQVFLNTDVKLKLKSSETVSLHKLYFKLLKRLFPEERDFIKSFEQCYIQTNDYVESLGSGRVSPERFANIVNRRITEAYQQYWKVSCVLMRDGKLRAYTGKLSDQMSQALECTTQSTQHDILNWLSPHPSSRYHGIFHDSGTSRMQGTCDWVIQDEKFYRWYASGGSALLFLCGNMGTGKTYSISRVIDWVTDGLSTKHNSEAFAYFYCNKQDPLRSEPKEILRNIIRQLATGPWKDIATNTTVHKSVSALWRQDRKQGILSTFAEWETCLLDLVDTYPRTTIVLDALDECKMQQRQDLTNLLVKLANRKSDTMVVKVFVSSRPEDDVLLHLDKYQVIRMQEKNAEDIAIFIRAKIAEHGEWSSMAPEFRKHLVDTLLQRSRDMFLFASLQIDSLKDCWLEDDIQDGLNKLPATLTAAYEEIYQRATERPAAKTFVDRALRWVMCSARPLTTDELLFAICQNPEDSTITATRRDVSGKLISKLCRNLLNLEDCHKHKYPVWRLAHQAVADFLEESTCCSSSLAHCESGKVCLTILLDTFGTKTTNLRSSTPETSEPCEDFECPCKPTNGPDDDKTHRTLQDPLAQYAAYGWPTHVRAQEDDPARNINLLSQALCRFLGHPNEGSPAYKRWLKHSFGLGKDLTANSEWSIFKTRPMPSFLNSGTMMMAPTTLACHLGIYKCLLDWWNSSNIDYDQFFGPSGWNPNLRWRELISIKPSSLRWSLIALACAHNETSIIKHLLERNVQVNTEVEGDVPPVVAATVAGSVAIVENLIEHGAEIFSSFTTLNDHLLRIAIRGNFLDVMELLLRQPALSQPQKVAEVLRSVDIEDFKFPSAITVLIDMGVDVNMRLEGTGLKGGNLLVAAACSGWEDLVIRILKDNASVVSQILPMEFNAILEAAMNTGPFTPQRSCSLSIVALLLEHGPHVASMSVTESWAFPRSHVDSNEWKGMLKRLVACTRDLDETWTDWDGMETTALIEAVKGGDMDHIRLLVENGANASLHVGGKYENALDCVFVETLRYGSWETAHYPTDSMIEVLVDAGATLENLKDDHLHTALAAVAFAGLKDRVKDLLDRGANPNACCKHNWHTALGAAAVSGHPEAPEIVDMLLRNCSGDNASYSVFQNARIALDYPFLFLIDSTLVHSVVVHPSDRNQLKDSWLRSACELALHNAVWDIDLKQWRDCLNLKDHDFSERNSEILDQLQEVLKNNRTSFFLKFPEAASDEEWSIKGAWSPNPSRRNILRSMLRYL